MTEYRLQDDPELYAVPSAHNIIDTINPLTGLSRFCGETDTQIQARYPGAQRYTWETWTAQASASQRTPITWEPSTKDQYHEMLEILPPALWTGGAFLVGEPCDHDVATGQPRFQGYRVRGLCSAPTYWASSRPITCAELRAELVR